MNDYVLNEINHGIFSEEDIYRKNNIFNRFTIQISVNKVEKAQHCTAATAWTRE